jgi:hypothetical protein
MIKTFEDNFVVFEEKNFEILLRISTRSCLSRGNNLTTLKRKRNNCLWRQYLRMTY